MGRETSDHQEPCQRTLTPWELKLAQTVAAQRWIWVKLMIHILLLVLAQGTCKHRVELLSRPFRGQQVVQKDSCSPQVQRTSPVPSTPRLPLPRRLLVVIHQELRLQQIPWNQLVPWKALGSQ